MTKAPAFAGAFVLMMSRVTHGISDWPDHCYMQIVVDGIRVYEHTVDNSMPPIDLTSYFTGDLAAVETRRSVTHDSTKR